MTTFKCKVDSAIVGGPSKSNIVDALKYAYDKENRHLSCFTLDNGVTFAVRVEGLAHEDGSGFSFNINGTVCFVNRKRKIQAPEWINNATVNLESQNINASIYYNARTQKGVLHINGGEGHHQFTNAAGM